jgi:putative cardiolipin synthase
LSKYILLLFLLSYIGALTLPYAAHKEVSAAYREEFQKKNFYSDTPSPERAAYIDDNMDALLFRLRMIEDAREEIILSTFDFNDDEAGRDIMASLLHAAEEGVSVRIIVDGISGFLDMRNQPSFLALASHENVSVKIYNPVNLLLPWKLQARLHDKYLIIDKNDVSSWRQKYDQSFSGRIFLFPEHRPGTVCPVIPGRRRHISKSTPVLFLAGLRTL